MALQTWTLFVVSSVTFLLFFTGFIIPLFSGAPLTHVALLLHLALGGLLAAALVFLGFLLGGDYLPPYRQPAEGDLHAWLRLGIRFCFWVMLLLALPLLSTVTLSMNPWIRTGLMPTLLLAHQVTAFLFSLALVGFVTLFFLSKTRNEETES
ncbi:MAG: hypothetical protein RBU29_11680 [bacterium]|jgi:hypothetical protein|nr:hypothetical protein [bacterium]